MRHVSVIGRVMLSRKVRLQRQDTISKCSCGWQVCVRRWITIEVDVMCNGG